MRNRFQPCFSLATTCVFLFLATLPKGNAWEPGTSSPAATSGFSVNTANRRDVLAFYQCVYKASESFAANMAWTGNVAGCVPGTTSAVFKNDVLRRVNFFRAMAGLPATITFNATNSSKAQEAALMMSSNGALDHFPPNTWSCYTANGYQAAGASNIALGNYGPAAVNAYMRDDGSNNIIVGHRRWILYSRAQEMGTGDIPPNGSYNAANALWVIGNFKTAPAPTFVAWPNQGYVPSSLVPARWSLSYPGADFSAAVVTMSQLGTNVPLTVISRSASGVGDSTIVWEPTGIPSSVTNDLPYTVSVTNIGGGGPTSKVYNVILFNPDILGDAVTIAGTATPSTTGQGYTFNSIEQADSYELEVSTGSAAAWTEGAEDAPSPQITEAISGGYALRQTELIRTGAKAFQLTFPSGSFNDQAFTVTRNILPSASSELRFYDRARFTVTSTTLHAQVSTDNGTNWTTLTSRSGVGLNSSLWDSNWIYRSASLAPYAGQIVQIRFIMKRNGGSVTQGTGSSFGFFVDDVTVTNATQLVNANTTTLAGSATSFALNATTAGSPLVDGTSYFMRIRPNVGCRWFGFGGLKTVAAQFVPVVFHSIAVTPSPAAGGSVSGGGSFATGTNRTVTATAKPGYRFLNWKENGTIVSSAASYPFTLAANRNLVASFQRVYQTIISPTTNGSVSVSPAVTPAGGTAVFTAAPAKGFIVKLWIVNGQPRQRGGDKLTLANINANQTVKAEFMIPTDDFNADGKNDLLWQLQSNGQTRVWFMNNKIRLGTAAFFPQPANADWQLVGHGDFNGDNSNDLVWQNRLNGDITLWYFKGVNRILGGGLLNRQPGTNLWRVAAVADFDDDGMTDIVLQNQSTGNTRIWLLNRSRQVRAVTNFSHQMTVPSWRLCGAGDADKDGNEDLIWQHQPTGQLNLWTMKGLSRFGSGPLNTQPGTINWRVSAFADHNRDSRADLVLQNTITGKTMYWYLNARTVTQGGMPGAQLNSPAWHVRNSRTW